MSPLEKLRLREGLGQGLSHISVEEGWVNSGKLSPSGPQFPLLYNRNMLSSKALSETISPFHTIKGASNEMCGRGPWCCVVPWRTGGCLKEEASHPALEQDRAPQQPLAANVPSPH